MNYLSVEDLYVHFGEKIILDHIRFGLEQGEKMALVGINGSGKSTLLKVITGRLAPNSGEVTFRKDIKVSFLEQNPSFESSETAIDYVLMSEDPIFQIIREYENLMSHHEMADSKKMSDCISAMDAHQAWDIESQIKQILGKLNIHDLEQPVNSMSGGQKKRIALARTLLEKPNLLILDEPTNHLDLDVIEWLEQYLSVQKMSLLLVTHDRYFLDQVTTSILELDQGKVNIYKGNYKDFLEKKSERLEQEQSEVQKAKNLLRKELDWMRRQPKARGTKAKYRIDAFHDLKDKAQNQRTDQEVEIKMQAGRVGKTILEIEGISKSFGENPVIKDFSYIFKKGDRIGVVGRNGSGKSTLLNLITSKLKPDSGEIKVGQTIKFGYYTQEELVCPDDMKVIDYVQEVAEVIKLTDKIQLTAMQLLNKFAFPPKKQRDYIVNLSGGEKRRLQLLRVLMGNPNFMILDEPTNDLDLLTLNTLEDYLESFPGCLLIVSHDRYFLDRLADHLFICETGKEIRDYNGNFTDYRLERKELAKEDEVEVKNPSKSQGKIKTEKNRKLTFSEKQELEYLEKEIEKLETRKSELLGLLNSGEMDHEKLAQWGAELEDLEERLEEKEMRWLELSEI